MWKLPGSFRPFTPGLAAIAVLLAGCAGKPVDERIATEKADSRPAGCIESTGSRIPSKDECSAVPGRSHSREDLERAGGATLEEKLRVLDPTIGP